MLIRLGRAGIANGNLTPPSAIPETASAPSAISNLAAGTPGETSMPLTWSAPEANGSAITDYVVEYKTSAAGSYTTFSDGTSATTGATVTGLTADTEYNFRVAAVNGEGTGAYSNVVTATTAAISLILEPPVSSDILADAFYAYGFSRLVHGYTGNTVRLKRLSDNAEADFGFDSIGAFDEDAVVTWAAGASVDVVHYKDQMGSADVFPAVGQVSYLVSGVVQRFGTDFNTSTAALTRSTSNGGVGADLGSERGYLATSNLTLDASGGLEVHMLWSHNERKTSNASDPLGGNQDDEYIFTYGHSENYYVRHAVGRGSSIDETRVKILTNTNQLFKGGAYKQNAQFVASTGYNGTTYGMYARGEKITNGTMNAASNTGILAGDLDDGRLIVGNTFTGTSGNLRTSDFMNGIFGGIILTGVLTDLERFTLQAKLSAIGQQHRIATEATISGYFDEIFLMKNTNGTTGLLAGEKAQSSLQFNISTGTPSFTFNRAHEKVGLVGVYADDDDNFDNGFKATNTFYSGVTSGTVMGVFMLDDTGNNASYSNSLATHFVQGTGSELGTSNDPRSLAIGFDHGELAFESRMHVDRDDDTLIGRRKKADETLFDYDGVNQPKGKYNFKTSHRDFTYTGETIDSYAFTEATWKNVDGSAPYLLDAPTGADTPENASFSKKVGVLLTQIATFEAPSGYDRADSYATRKAARLDATSKSYAFAGLMPLGHEDGAVAINPNAGVVDSADNSYIMTQNYQLAFKGTRFMIGLSTDVLTQAQIEEVHINSYKLLT